MLLVDTGMGTHPEVDAHYRPRRRLPEALRAAGSRPDDVTEVANCHLHFDHCGGTPRWPACPSSSSAASSPRRGTEDYTLPELLDPPGTVRQELDGEAEIVPGVMLVPTPGHTDGHQSLVVRRSDGSVVVAGQSHDNAHGYASDVLALRAHRDGHGEPLPIPAEWMATLQELDPWMVVFAHDHSVWVP